MHKQIDGGGFGDAFGWRALAQLLGAGQVGVAPGGGLGHIAHLFIGFGQKRFGCLVAGLGHHHMVKQLGSPTRIAFIQGLLRGGHDFIGTAQQLQVALAHIGRSQRIEVGRVAIVKAKVKLVHRFNVVAQVAVVAAHRHEFGQ